MQHTAKATPQRIASLFLFSSLVISMACCAVRLLMLPEGPERSVCMLMLLQCLLGLLVMPVPSLLTRHFHLPLPAFLHVLYYVFLFCAVVLGEVFSFYMRYPHWDTLLHFTSGIMLCFLGFTLCDSIAHKGRSEPLSPVYTAAFAFCFALAMGGLWEIYEYIADGLLSLNMQKFLLPDGAALSGRAALTDTMDDLIIDAFSALLAAVTGCAVRTFRRHHPVAVSN